MREKRLQDKEGRESERAQGGGKGNERQARGEGDRRERIADIQQVREERNDIWKKRER